MRHLADITRKRFTGDFMDNSYTAAQTYNHEIFDKALKKLREKNAAAADCHENEVGAENSSMAYFLCHWYEVITTNISESINAMFLYKREFPMVALFNSINERFHQIFIPFFNKVNTILVPRLEKLLRYLMDVSSCFVAYNWGNGDFAVVVENKPEDSEISKIVSLIRRTYTYRQFDLNIIPCIYAMTVVRLAFGDEYDCVLYQYTSEYYMRDTYLFTYGHNTCPIHPKEEWILPRDYTPEKIKPPQVQAKMGWKRVKPIHSMGKSFTSKKRKNICS